MSVNKTSKNCPSNGSSSKNSPARAELLALSKELCGFKISYFKAELERWQERHKDFLNKKSIDDNSKWRYTHTKVRSAHLTFKRNLEFLFTYESVENLTKQTMACESEFAHLKRLLELD